MPADDLKRHELPRLLTEVPGPASRRLADAAAQAECPAFDARRKERATASGEAFAPIVYAEGLGANVWDVDGNRFVDFVAGFGALSLGHRAALVEDAKHRQDGKLGLALGDVYASSAKVELLIALRALFPGGEGRVMLGLSGADAVTAALKTAALATGKAGVVAFEGGYHGLSHGPLAACGLRESFRAPFAGQTGSFVRFAPYPKTRDDLAAALAVVRDALAAGDVGAILVEPILGRGGVVIPPETFLSELEALARKHGALLVADEIWTGMGRSGAVLESVRAGIRPDVICIGKALGGGEPISACIGSEQAMAAWGAAGGGTLHTATHFGAPPACAAALSVVREIDDAAFLSNVARSGDALMAAIRSHVDPAKVADVRGRGLMIGIELSGGGSMALAVMMRMLRRGYIVLTGGTRGDVLTLTPPLNVDPSLFEPFAAALASSLEEA